MVDISGSMVALVTPMHADGGIDYAALETLVDFHVENGTSAIVAVGTTGESATLSFIEHEEVIEAIIRLADGRLPVIAGTGANATAEAIRLTRHAQEAGADACLLVTPYYNKPTQEGLYQHFHAVAEAVDVPQILYNVPSRCGVDMLAETTARLAEVENIIGIKEAKGEVRRFEELKRLCPPDFILLSGDDGTAMESILAGGRGDISVTANVAPKLMQQMCAAALAGDETKARELDWKLRPLHESLFVESNPIPVKWALQQMGMIESGIRLPMTPLSEQHHATVREALQSVGVL